MYAACKIVDVFIERMGGNGITIASDLWMPERGLTYASGWYLERITVVGCKGHGLSVSGANAGAGLCLHFVSSQNGGYGFHDASTVGNTYVSARSEDDADGFHATDPNAPHTFVGCYMEGKGATTFDGGASLIVGGASQRQFAGIARLARFPLGLPPRVHAGHDGGGEPDPAGRLGHPGVLRGTVP